MENIIPLLRRIRSDIVYLWNEKRQLRKFTNDIRSGIQRAEPRFREIIDLSVSWPAGSVEHAHLSRYYFAASVISGTVLNAACGCGYGNEILAQVGAYPVGVDLFKKPLELARKNFPVGSYVRADVTLTAFQANTFDSVVSFETIEHVNDPLKACAEFKRVLKHNGLFVGSIPIMVFHNPGTNFTYRQARYLVETNFPGSELHLQDNYKIIPFSARNWELTRAQGDKFLLWTWRKTSSYQ